LIRKRIEGNYDKFTYTGKKVMINFPVLEKKTSDLKGM